MLALIACTESPKERLDSFEAATEIICYYPVSPVPNCVIDTSADQVLACMNDALVGGGHAQVSTTTKDDRGFDIDTYWFTSDHHAYKFESVDTLDEPSVYEQQSSCAGPFRIQESGYRCFDLVIEGCP